ncbi:two-component system activity regulator YycH [Holzapfeliella sp. JNUCC 72]
MQFKNYIVRFVLVGLVTLSLFLTFLIWTSNQSLEQEKYENPIITNENNALNDQNFARIFSPTQVVNYQNGQNYVLINQQNDLISSLLDKMKSWNLKINRQEVFDEKSYLDKLNNQNNVQIAYTDAMSLNVFAEVIDKKDLKQSEDFTFNRIFIPKELDNHIYFANDQTKEILTVERGGYDAPGFSKLVDDYGFKSPVKFMKLASNRYVLNYITQPQLSVYSYMINRDLEDNYVYRLLGNNSTSTQNNYSTTYKLGSSKRLVVDKDNDQFQYSDVSITNTPQDTQGLFDRSFQAISSLKTRLVEWRYYSSSISTSDKQITYRNYVEGLPVFSQSENGVASVSYSSSGEDMSFTNQMLQVPIPPDGKVATLPTTSELMNQLKLSGYENNQIQDIELGFEWQKDATNNDLIDLVPTYYVKVNDKLANYETLINKTSTNTLTTDK